MTLPLHGFEDWQNPLHTADLQTDVQNTNINAGGQFTSAVFDMRPYQSISLMLSAVSNVSPPTGAGNVCYQIQWWANAAGSQIIYQERYEIFPQGAGGIFASQLGRAMHRGPVFGPYMSLTVSSSGPDQINMSYRILANTKPAYARTYLNTDINGHATSDNELGLDFALFAPVLAGATVNAFFPMRKGRSDIQITANGGPWNVQIITPAAQPVYQNAALPAGITPLSIAMPSAALRCQIVNNTGANNIFQVAISSEMQNW